MNTPAKWNKVVDSMDSAKKFDDIALKILDDDDINIFEFRDIIVKLSEDVKSRRPECGDLITLLSDTVVELLDFLSVKAMERLTYVMQQMADMEEKL